MDIKRRRIIQGASASTVLSLYGCNLFDRFSKPGQLSYAFIDAHGHFFNASDLQAGAYLLGPVLNDELGQDLPPKVRSLLAYFGKLIQKVGDLVAISAERELQTLEQKQLTERFDNEGFLGSIDVGQETRDASKRFYDALTQAQRSNLGELLWEAQNDGKLKAESFVPENEFNQNTIADAILNDDDDKNVRRQALLGNKDNASRGYVIGYLAFIGRMFRKRSVNLAEHKKRYSTKKAEYAAHVTDVLVDFDYWLGGSHSASSMQDQVLLHKKLHQITGGFNLPILGVNPIKVILQRKEYLTFIDSTLEQGIFRGVKIYPTLGYSPNGNLIDDFADSLQGYPKDKPLPTKQTMQQALDDIYRICIKHRAVVMAHTDRSKGVNQTSPNLAGPDEWEKVLKRHKQLAVNFGHMGELVDVDDPASSWTHRFLRLMDTYDNVYGDLGYWFEITKKDGVGRLDRIIREVNPSPNKLYQRVMFGTDWYMISTQRRWNAYAKNAIKSFQSLVEREVILQSDMDNVFRNNAARLFRVSVSDDAP